MDFAMYQVMELIGWTRQEYCDFKFNMGIGYLRQTLKDEDAVTQVSLSAHFWGWWKAHWHRREADMLWRLWKCSNAATVESVYRTVNHPYNLSLIMTPYGAELEDSYCKDLVPLLN
jgi:hypothetical protein